MNSIYKVELKKDVIKYIKKQDKTRRQQIKDIIDLLSENPYQVKNIKPIIGADKNLYRVRLADLRILYKVNDIDYKSRTKR